MISMIQNITVYNSPLNKANFSEVAKCADSKNNVFYFSSIKQIQTKQHKIQTFGAKSDESVFPYIKEAKSFKVNDVSVVCRKVAQNFTYTIKKNDEKLGQISLNQKCRIKVRIGETSASDGKSGLSVITEFPNGLIGVIPQGGSLAANGICVNLSQIGASDDNQYQKKQQSFTGNLVVTTGYRPYVAETLVPKYFNEKIVDKNEPKTRISSTDIDVIELTAGLGSRLAALTSVSKTNKPGIQLPYSNGYLMYSSLDSLHKSGLINGNSPFYLMNDPALTGAANHVILAKQKGFISGNKPVLVCPSDQIHDIDLDKAIKKYEEIKEESKRNPEKPMPLAMIITAPVGDYRGLGLVSSNENGQLNKFVEKPKADDEAKMGLIIDRTASSVRIYCANTGIYILSPEFVDVITELAPRLKNLDTGILDFGNDTIPRLNELCKNGLTIANGKIIKKDLTGMAIYTYNAEGSSWCDVGGCVQDYIDTAIEMANGKYNLNPSRLKEVKDNINEKNKIVCTPQAKKILTEMNRTQEYGEILSYNTVFLTKDATIKEPFRQNVIYKKGQRYQ